MYAYICGSISNYVLDSYLNIWYNYLK